MKENKEINIKIEGMSCAACAITVEKSIAKVSGVESVGVSIANDTAAVKFDDALVNEKEIYDAVEKAGYKVAKNHETVTLKITGMTCTACSSRVEKALNQLDGVINANVNFASGKATVKYDPTVIRLSDLGKTVKEAGYKVDDENTQTEDTVLKTAKSKMIISAILSSVIMSLMIINMFVTPVPGYTFIAAVLAAPIVFGAGLDVHKGSIKAIRSRNANMDVLVTLGSVPPYIIGLMGFFIPVQSFIEMASTIITFHLIGKFLEAKAKGRASDAIRKLIQMGAKTASILIDGEEKQINAQDLRPEDIMVIRPGEKIPTDGVVIEGFGLVDESMATGESVPAERKPGDKVIGATVNKQGMLKVKVTKVGNDTFLAQVVKLMEQCQGSKVPIQEFADKVTGYFVPAILILTALTFISFNLFSVFHLNIVRAASEFLPWVNPELNPLTLSFITATAVLVISCPCALGLGTPTALMVGSGMGALRGILIRNGEAVQTMKDIKIIAFDKTGTITKGKPEVTDIIPLEGFDEDKLMYYAYAAESYSEHPIAFAVIEKAHEDSIKKAETENFDSLSGMGVKGRVDGRVVLAGSRKLMKEEGVQYLDHENTLENLEEEAKTAIMIAVEGELAGIIAVADPIKEDSAFALKKLRELGIETAMITGDNSRTAQAIAHMAGISHVIADVLPKGKVDEIIKLQNRFGLTAMVGDGINDAPALKQANVGIAIGTGTDIAIEAADVTLVRGELTGLVSAIKLSSAIFAKIKSNYFWAWFYNAVAIPLAMLGLLHPMIGAAAMAFSSLNVVYNSLRLKKVNIEA